MAILTDSQKREIVTALGYPFNYTGKFNIFTQDLPADVIIQINFLLSEINRVSTAIVSGFDNLSLKRVEDIEFFPIKDNDVITSFYNDKKRFIHRLSDLLAIPIAYEC
jgi:hypothetical protein